MTPRVMISGRDDRAARLRARHLGASGFISKSLNPQVIMAAIDSILMGGVFFDEPDMETPEDDDEELTPRQLEVLDLLAKGCANKEIEDRLGLADRTVRAHLTVIFKTLGVQSRIRAVIGGAGTRFDSVNATARGDQGSGLGRMHPDALQAGAQFVRRRHHGDDLHGLHRLALFLAPSGDRLAGGTGAVPGGAAGAVPRFIAA